MCIHVHKYSELYVHVYKFHEKYMMTVYPCLNHGYDKYVL
jgi:hypothetical protein